MSRVIPKISSIIDALVETGGTLDQVRAVIAAAEAQQEAQDERIRLEAEAELERKRALKRAGNAERQRKLRTSRLSQRDSALPDVTERDSALLECDQGREGARADEDKLPLDLQEKETPKGVSKKKVLRKPETRIAVDTQPEPDDRAEADRSGMDAATFRHQWALFRDWHIKNDQGARDWRAAWRTWARKWVGDGCKLVGGARAPAAARAAAMDPSDPRIDFGGGVSAPLSTIRRKVEQGGWRPEWRGRPDEPGCVIPREFWSQILPKKAQAEQPPQGGLFH